MIELTREEFKSDVVFGQLHDHIKRNHRPAEHTIKSLIENKHIKDFCQVARHFCILEKHSKVFIHYDTENWFTPPDGVAVKIISICIYDDFLEYEKNRLPQLQSAKNSEGANLN